MARLFILFIGFLLLHYRHALEEKMFESERQEQLAKSDSLFALGVELYDNGKFEEAVPIFAESDRIDKAVLDSTSNRRDYSAMWLASCYCQLGDTIKAEETHKYYAYAPIDRRLTVRSDSLSAAGLIAFNNGDLENALTCFEQCAEIEKSVVGENHIWYLNSLSAIVLICSNLADYSSNLGNYTEAARLGTEALNIYEKVYGKGHPNYAILLNNLANYYADSGNCSEAIRLGTEALNVIEENGFDDTSREIVLQNMADLNEEQGYYLNAITYATKALSLYEKNGDSGEEYIELLKRLARYHYEAGNFEDALALYTKAYKTGGDAIVEDKDKVEWLLDLAMYNYRVGNRHKAGELSYEASMIAMDAVKNDSTENIELLNLYSRAMNDVAFLMAQDGDFNSAVMYGNEALSTRIKIYGFKSKNVAASLLNMTHYLYKAGQYEKAKQFGGIGVQLVRDLYGETHTEYFNALSSLSTMTFFSGDASLLRQTNDKATTVISNYIKKSFAEYTSEKRSLLWEQYKIWFQGLSHLFSYFDMSESVVANGYNSILLSKGLLLNSEIEFTKLIQESGDDTISVLYENLRNMRTLMNKLWEGYASADSIQLVRMRQIADSLSREADKVEQQLVERSKVYGDFTKNLVITWPQVQEKLGDKDAAVEFVSFPLNADSTMYIAYVLRKDWACPRMIPLFEEKELEAVEGYDYYTTPSVSRLVWEPLEEMLEGAEHVYFSPGGDLYNIAIESVPDHLDPAHIVSERRDYYRLSSTRELALIQDDYTWTEGAVYGGLDYNMGVSSLAADEAHYAQSASDSQRERGIDLSYYYLGGEGFAEGIRSDRKSSGLLDSLPGTREEAVAIKAQLDDISVPSSLYTDDLGTEASFKALDGQRTSIIHIGTHGFFNTKKAEYQETSSLLMTSDQQTVRVEDDALSRSGLCMAGANNLLTNAEALPDSLDDGWLTALEIAHLDLRGLDMVVLSACKTGVGEVTGDGVFGLQRGFKKAGARTLVMSLWNVPDQLTCYFMKEFFARISVDANGHPTNKHAAFLQAQQAARTHWQEVDPFAASYDWAAFILLDGVD